MAATERAPRRRRRIVGVAPNHAGRRKLNVLKTGGGMRAENKRSPKSKSEDGWDEVDAFVAGDHLNERQRRIEKLAAKIMVLWYRCAQAIYDTGVACAREDKRLIPIDKKALLKKLPFSASRFSKLVQIGKDGRLPEIMKRLPPSFSSIYLVSTLSNEQLKIGLDAGIINTEARRKDIEHWRDGLASEAPAGASPKPLSGAPAKATGKHSRTGSVVEEDDYFNFSEDEESNATESDSSEETATIYAALVAEWKAKGRLSRTSWLATPPVAREKFNEFLLHQPYLPKAAE